MFRMTVSSLAAACLGVAVGGAALAGEPVVAGDAPATIVIHASNADLHTEKGARALALRIRVAAANVCGADVDPLVRFGDGFARCEASAIAGAVGSVRAPMLADALGQAPRQFAGADR